MYPSGRWDGFWVQEPYGRQSMRAFELHFAADGNITGHGVDMVGRFAMSGAYDPETGRVLILKQYLGKHAVQYTGDPDGEGSIQGTWVISYRGVRLTGSFLMRPVVGRPTGGEPIEEIG